MSQGQWDIPSTPFKAWSGYRVNTLITTIQDTKNLAGNIFQVNPDFHVFRIDFLPFNSAAQSSEIRVRKDGQLEGQGLVIPSEGLFLWNEAQLARRDQYKIDFSVATEEVSIIQHYLEKITHAV